MAQSTASTRHRDELRSRLVSHLQALARDRNPYLAPQGHFYAQYYIRQQLGQWGEVYAQPFEQRGQQHANWCLTLPGQQRRAPIVVGAHYDTVPGTPGADDNATGVAALLELARLWHRYPGRRPLQLVAFDLEEFGWGGSRSYVEQLTVRPHIMLSLEMLGYCDPTPGSQRYPAGLGALYPSQGDFIALIGNWQTVPAMLRLQRGCRQVGLPCLWLPMVARGSLLPAVRRSDHAPFWDAGYSAILVTDTAELRNPHYHSPADTLATLDMDFLTGVCLGLYTGLKTL